MIISLVIFLLYGGALQSLFTYVPGISWTGHLFGFISGVLAIAVRLGKFEPILECLSDEVMGFEIL